ncbi:MAG: precorrin-3B C(17)-methyltransferase [Thermoactinomyces sp.]
MSKRGKLFLVGFGPGDFRHITERAREAIRESEVIVGYNTYVGIIRDLLTDQEIVQTGMTGEVRRVQEAVRQAEQGKTVAVISSGDAGVYGIAGLVFEVLIEKDWHPDTGVEVEVVPGISAINSCASLLGSPVMHDACMISLSDHLTSWESIARRIEAAAAADFVIAFYNPKSRRRTRQIEEARRILLQYRSPETPVGLVKNAYREQQQVVLTTLGEMLNHEIGMLSTVLIGNSTTFVYQGIMVTPRGYQRKYTLGEEEPGLKLPRLKADAEPWSLEATEKAGSAEWKATANVEGSAALVELAVSPGVVNKKLAARQLALLAEIAGDKGEVEYTPHHYVILRVPADQSEQAAERLREARLLVSPAGNFVRLKACDFCDGKKRESIPYAKELARRLAGQCVPRALEIGFNGCAMACYGAVTEEIGIVYCRRQGTFDLFLGGRRTSRNVHPAQKVAEGILPDELVETVERVVREYAAGGKGKERFHKFFSRAKGVAGFVCSGE